VVCPGVEGFHSGVSGGRRFSQVVCPGLEGFRSGLSGGGGGGAVKIFTVACSVAACVHIGDGDGRSEEFRTGE
jgi:hypothetical protein